MIITYAFIVNIPESYPKTSYTEHFSVALTDSRIFLMILSDSRFQLSSLCMLPIPTCSQIFNSGANRGSKRGNIGSRTVVLDMPRLSLHVSIYLCRFSTIFGSGIGYYNSVRVIGRNPSQTDRDRTYSVLCMSMLYRLFILLMNSGFRLNHLDATRSNVGYLDRCSKLDFIA